MTPGEADAALFAEEPSCAFWRDWRPPSLAPTPAGLVGLGAEVMSEARDASGMAYVAYHAARTAFFAAQGAAGLLAAGQAKHPLTGARGAEALAAAARLVAEACATYKQDLGCIRAGVYGLPWDMTSLRHRQYSPAFVADRGARFLREAAATLGRRDAAAAGAEATPLWLRSPLYPEYYVNAWHHQSDGWLSPASAKVYDASTESLFIGRQDAMQRAALGLLCRHLRGDAAGDGGAPPSPDASTAPAVLDVACGTGRLLTFIRDEFPSAAVTALDLSPFYLAEAREASAHWEALRGSGRGSAHYVQAAAEAMPFADASFDAITCVYLFHEIPPEARVAVAAQIARLLRPGGVAVLADSVQLGDRPALDHGLGKFGDFNEPNYRSYIELDLGALLQSAGLRPARKALRSVTKVLSFTKPHAHAA